MPRLFLTLVLLLAPTVLGNVYCRAGGGIALRFGFRPPDDFALPRIDDPGSLRGNSEQWSGFVFVRAAGTWWRIDTDLDTVLLATTFLAMSAEGRSPSVRRLMATLPRSASGFTLNPACPYGPLSQAFVQRKPPWPLPIPFAI